MTIAAWRAALVTAVSSTGIATLTYPTPNPIPGPNGVALILPRVGTYLLSAAQDATYEFTVRILAGKVSEVGAQTLLDAYLDASGSQSIPAAIANDRSLSGTAYGAQALRFENYGGFVYGEATYLGAEIPVQFYAL